MTQTFEYTVTLKLTRHGKESTALYPNYEAELILSDRAFDEIKGMLLRTELEHVSLKRKNP